MGPGLIEEDVDVVDDDPDEAQLADAPFFVDELEDSREGDDPSEAETVDAEPLPSHFAPADPVHPHTPPGAAHRLWQECAKVESEMSQMECCRLRNSQSTTMRCGWLCSTRFGSEEHTRRTVRLLTAMDTFSKRSSMRIHSPLRQGEEWRLFCLSLSR